MSHLSAGLDEAATRQTRRVAASSNSVLSRMGQYGAMHILYSTFLKYPAIPTCSAYSHNFLRVHDAASENKISKKIKELGRIQDRRGLSPILLIVTAVSNMIPINLIGHGCLLG